jgi:hypothetical protein
MLITVASVLAVAQTPPIPCEIRYETGGVHEGTTYNTIDETGRLIRSDTNAGVRVGVYMVRVWSYDALGRPIRISTFELYPWDDDFNFVPDAVTIEGRSPDELIFYTYDSEGRLTTEMAIPATRSMRLTTWEYQESAIVETFRSLGDPIRIREIERDTAITTELIEARQPWARWGGDVPRFTGSQHAEFTDDDGIVTTTHFDESGRFTRQELLEDGAIRVIRTHAYDDEGRLIESWLADGIHGSPDVTQLDYTCP